MKYEYNCFHITNKFKNAISNMLDIFRRAQYVNSLRPSDANVR